MATILWCYLRNDVFKQDKDYHLAADLTGQANHIGVTIEADIIKQKLPENNGGYKAVTGAVGKAYGRTSENDVDRKSTRLNSSHPSRPRMPSSA